MIPGLVWDLRHRNQESYAGLRVRLSSPRCARVARWSGFSSMVDRDGSNLSSRKGINPLEPSEPLTGPVRLVTQMPHDPVQSRTTVAATVGRCQATNLVVLAQNSTRPKLFWGLSFFVDTIDQIRLSDQVGSGCHDQESAEKHVHRFFLQGMVFCVQRRIEPWQTS